MLAVADLGRPLEVALALERSASTRRASSSSFSSRIAAMASFSACQWASSPSVVLAQVGELLVEPGEPLGARRSSVSFASATRSISSWRMRRSTTSISVGIESISMRRRLAASSTRSIALSGRKRPVM